jgi:acyl-CoA synthetase (AMP-forming)/AMP-acid ligase II
MSVKIEPHRGSDAGRAARATNLVDLLRDKAMRQPDDLAFTFLADGEQEECGLTYAELDRRARAAAGWLQTMRLEGQRALLVYPPGLDYVAAFFGCLYAGVVAIPVPPVNPAQAKRGLPQLESIVKDARPALALTAPRILSKIDQLLSKATGLGALRWQSPDQLPEDHARQWRRPEVGGQTLAYLQYTSGSTAAAKGVMVSHGNVIHNSEDIAQVLRHTPESVLVSWLPHFHDMGLVYGIIQPMYAGIPGVLMSPAAFIQRPVRWLRAMSDYRASTSGGPNFAYQLCAHKVTPEQCEALDLSRWRVAINGAEPVRRETLEQFALAFEPCGFRLGAFCPAYGLAEATLMATTAPRREPPVWLKVDRNALAQNRVAETTEGDANSLDAVGCGRPSPGTVIKVVNPDTLAECAAGEVGEIWVCGPGVAQGYWNRPDETELTFKARARGKSEGPFLRTGDLGFARDGELFVSGRLKDLIIIAGRNHYPQDIELTAEKSHPALRPGCCAAFSVEVCGEERLIVAVELSRQFKPRDAGSAGEGQDGAAGETPGRPASEVDAEAVTMAIRRAVAEGHEIQVYKVVLLKTGGILKTSSGKTQRRACRESFLSGSLLTWGTDADTSTAPNG